MTDIQYERWKEFAIRMAKGYPNVDQGRASETLAQVEEYFRWREFHKDWSEIQDWDGNNDNYYLGSAVADFFDSIRPEYDEDEDSDEVINSLYNQVTCCIRAAFDVAVCPSGGVVGFTAGNVRHWWNMDVPDWVKEYFKEPFDSFGENDEVWL